jgi:hypothetical protein
MLEILKKLRSNSPEWYERYVIAFETEASKQVITLLSCPQEQLARQQGVCAAFASHLEKLKQAM